MGMSDNVSKATGHPLPEGMGLPKMKGRKKFIAKDMIKLLDEALEDLSKATCSFWACEGPQRPQHMVTCNKCWAMRNVATVRETIINANV